jgi:hypothetical protein
VDFIVVAKNWIFLTSAYWNLQSILRRRERAVVSSGKTAGWNISAVEIDDYSVGLLRFRQYQKAPRWVGLDAVGGICECENKCAFIVVGIELVCDSLDFCADLPRDREIAQPSTLPDVFKWNRTRIWVWSEGGLEGPRWVVGEGIDPLKSWDTFRIGVPQAYPFSDDFAIKIGPFLLSGYDRGWPVGAVREARRPACHASHSCKSVP